MPSAKLVGASCELERFRYRPFDHVPALDAQPTHDLRVMRVIKDSDATLHGAQRPSAAAGISPCAILMIQPYTFVIFFSSYATGATFL